MIARTFSRENGQALVLIALLMLALIAFLGLILDGGRVYANRRRSQDASDSAAYAGVSLLAVTSPGSSDQNIWNNIVTYASANGITTTTDIVASFIDQSGNPICAMPCGNIPSNSTGVWVTSTLQLQPYFISVVIGNTPIPISSIAKAQAGNLTQGDLLNPMVIFTTTFQYNQLYSLFGDKQSSNGFGWVDYGCASGASGKTHDIVNNLTLFQSSGTVMADPTDAYYNPSNPTQYNAPPPSPNPWICNGPGVAPNNQVSQALDCWLDLNNWPCASGSVPDWGPRPANNEWLVPIYDFTNGLTGDNAKYHTIMFGVFEFQGYWFASNQCNSTDLGGSYDCKNNPPPSLQLCESTPGDPGTLQRCVVGRFLKTIKNLPITPGRCNTNGINVCGYGLSR